MLDLDKFKDINDNMGHYWGDVLLKCISERFMQKIRKSDTVARLGGDEFVILLADVAKKEFINEMAEKILNVVSEPFVLNDQKVSISSSIGIASYPHHGNDLDTLLKCADKAMYKVKETGRNRAAFFQDN